MQSALPPVAQLRKLGHFRAGNKGDTIINTKILRPGTPSLAGAGLAAVIAGLILLAPALWNRYPLLQYDTGGYLARWYEGYLVPSRSTVYGIYLHLGESSSFWLDLVAQTVATVWIIHLILRMFGLSRPRHFILLMAALAVTTALPWLASMLLTDIFSGLAVLALYLLVIHHDRLNLIEKAGLFAMIAFGTASHSGTFAVMVGMCGTGWVVQSFLHHRISTSGLAQACMAVVTGALLLLGTNYALSRQLTWTPGGFGLLFGRLLEEGIAPRYLATHCPQDGYKLCAYRNDLPDTADGFLWGGGVFNTLGRFDGLGDEMRTIVHGALDEYPGLVAIAAIKATGLQLISVATGEGTLPYMAHTFGIIEHYIPAQVAPMRAARQQNGELSFDTINWIHVPVALASIFAVIVLTITAAWRRQLDEVSLLAATVTLALLGNAVVCGALSGPHDRYGARMVWITTLAVLIALARRLAPASAITAVAPENR